MVFSSLTFLFAFLPVFLVLYYCAPARWRNLLLLAGSLVFYGVGEPAYLLLILASVAVNFGIGLLIEQVGARRWLRRLVFLTGLGYDLGILFFFKYTDFLLENINALTGLGLPLLSLALPLGISFYTFQIVSYLADVYAGRIHAEHSPVTLGTYLCMFPQLVAGPIVVYSDIAGELSHRTLTIEKLDSGLKTFIVGLAYKVLLANRIGTLWNEVCTIGYESISTPLAWLGALAYSLQLYFDFCGYSLMAVGLGEMLGFTIPENFRHPYTARSVTDFWRRWHITLGAWFREYVYIPLGGNRRGRLRTMLNLGVVWLLTGLWHGAAWNFLLWGLFIYLFLLLEKNGLLSVLEKDTLPAKVVSHVYMAFYILVSWTIFAISDLSQLGVYLARMFPFWGIGETINALDFIEYLSDYGPLLALCLICCTGLPARLLGQIKGSAWGSAAALGVFWYAVYFLAIGVNNPFLYFRF